MVGDFNGILIIEPDSVKVKILVVSYHYSRAPFVMNQFSCLVNFALFHDSQVFEFLAGVIAAPFDDTKIRGFFAFVNTFSKLFFKIFLTT